MDKQPSTDNVVLREVIESDLPIFFDQQLDPEANMMAAFAVKDPTDRDAFMTRWTKILSNDTLTKRTILFDGQIAGYIVCFEMFGVPSVAYWLGKAYWRKGIATGALAAFLKEITVHPLYARVAKDNIASRRVLEKCGFAISGEDKGFAEARGQEIEEFIMELN